MSEACLHFFSGFVNGTAICANCGAVLYETREAIVERLESDLADARQKLAEAQADCAAKADAIRKLLPMAESGRVHHGLLKDTQPIIKEATAALASTAGDALVKELARLREELRVTHEIAERDSDEKWNLAAQRDAANAELERLRAALAKINVIRNSIIACQSFNFSEHAYPLVAALNEVGIKGMDYPEALQYFGSMLERTNKAEAEAADLRAQRDQAVLLARELGEVLKGSKSAMNNLAEMWSAEERGHDITSDKYDKKVQEWESKRTAALAKLAALNPPTSDDTLKV